MATYPRRSSYGIFVKFRRSRLALRRGIARIEDAFAIAEQLRADRFHDRGDIFVVKEPEGTIVELAPASVAETSSSPIPSATEPTQPPGRPMTVGETPRPAAPPVAVGETPRPPPRAASSFPPAPAPEPHDSAGPPALLRPAVAHQVAALLRLVAQADHVRGTVDRARAAQARFDRAFGDAERTVRSADATPPELLRNYERLRLVRASAARSVESFEQVAALVEHRLEAAWAAATEVPPPAR